MSKKTTILLAMLIAQISLFAQITIVKDLDPGNYDGFNAKEPVTSLGTKAYFVGYDGVAPKTFLESFLFK